MNKAKKSLFAGMLLVANALLKKAIGLISTLILARVLAPDDFGLVAITMLVLGFVEVFSVTGSQQYIFQKEKVTDDILNTAWTIDLILKVFVSLLLFLSAPFVADYYGDQQLVNSLRVIALLPILGALKNPGLLLLQKEQKYGAIIKQSILIKIVAVIVTISLALALNNFWALILGTLCTSILESAGSYLLHSHRPKFCLRNSKPQLVFSGWMTPQAILGYLRTQLDTFIVSSTYGKSQLGSYHVMKYLAFMPTSEVITPATQPLLVELSKVKNDRDAFTNQYRLSLIIVMAVALPMTAFLYAFDKILIELLLGTQWIKYADVFGALSGMVICFVILNQARRALVVFEKTKWMFYYEMVSFIGIYGTLLFIGLEDIITFTQNRILLEFAFCLSVFSIVAYVLIGFKPLIKLIGMHIPLLLCVFVSVKLTQQIDLTEFNIIIKLASYAILFSLTYLVSLLLSYALIYRKTMEGKYVKNLVLKALSKR
jgi:lipopolysaccharide exporter